MAAFQLRRQDHPRFPQGHAGLPRSVKKGLNDSGLQLKRLPSASISWPSLCHPPFIPMEVSVVLAVRHDMCRWEPPSGPTAEKLMAQLVGHQSLATVPRSSAILLWMVADQLPRAHDASRQPLLLCEQDADRLHEVQFQRRHLTSHGAGVHQPRLFCPIQGSLCSTPDGDVLGSQQGHWKPSAAAFGTNTADHASSRTWWPPGSSVCARSHAMTCLGNTACAAHSPEHLLSNSRSWSAHDAADSSRRRNADWISRLL